MKNELSSPIHEAVISGDLDLVRFMLENRAMPSLGLNAFSMSETRK